jgi:hypothetical protein
MWSDHISRRTAGRLGPRDEANQKNTLGLLICENSKALSTTTRLFLKSICPPGGEKVDVASTAISGESPAAVAKEGAVSMATSSEPDTEAYTKRPRGPW